ncbi:glycerol-3-phosphate-acyltransferase [Amanita muscaria]
MSSGDDTKTLHRMIRYVSGIVAASFFTEIRVIGGENVPKDGPIIVTATHHNMIIDPVILSVAFPYKRILNYWSKASLFANPLMRYILYSSGNIPVDRKSKDRQTLFEGTFDALSKGQAVALFPEGTSYTEPKIMQVKDGASWAALEFLHWLKNNPAKTPRREVQVIPAAIVYTNKSKYRSSVIMEFGRPITMDAYKDDFLSGEEGLRRAAVKRLTRTIEAGLTEMTVNASDWDTLFVARMARDLLWEGQKSLDLDDFVTVSQTLVDLFSSINVTPNANNVRRRLLDYYSLLQSSHLTNSVLSSLPLPSSLDPHTPASVPSRLFTLLILLKDSISAVFRLPFFLLPLLVHLPVYFTSRLGASLAEDEEETQAQNKVAFGLLSSLLIYPTTFFILWAFLYYKPAGGILAAFIVYMFASYHNRVIDDAYGRAKRIVAAWRVLVGVWAPKRWDLSLAALSQYTTPRVPPENPWIDKPKISPITSAATGETDASQHTKRQRKQRAPSRRIVRHVLRARIDAIKSLATFFDSLEKAGSGKKVKASSHLARLYGSTDVGLVDSDGWRYSRELVEFLKARGAKIPRAPKGAIEGWASGDDYTTTEE